MTMSTQLLVRYIRMALAEEHQARVPNQLLPAEDSGEGDRDEGESVTEFSGVGAIAGYTAPLGASPDEMGRKKNKPRRKQ